MKNVYNKFVSATARSVCHGRTCEQCHDIYETNGCPLDDAVSDRETCEFVSQVVRILADYYIEHDKDTNISETDLINMLISADND